MAQNAYAAIRRAYPDSVKYETNYKRLQADLRALDARTGEKIEYRWGEAFREGPEIATIHRLVALSDRRLREKADRKGDEHGPSGR